MNLETTMQTVHHKKMNKKNFEGEIVSYLTTSNATCEREY